MSATRPVLVAAGGTGGHLFPAQALSEALAARGVAVELVTDERASKFGGNFPARAIHEVPAATPSGGSMYARAKAIVTLIQGTSVARGLIKRVRPIAVVGFGGYPTVPPVLAATQLGVPTVLHEQNAVMGRANRFMANRVDAIATGFSSGAGQTLAAKSQHVGNPVRPAVKEAALTPYPDFVDGKLRLLVTGGSQGARVMSDIVPAALALLDSVSRAQIVITQQARGEDEARVREAYGALNMAADVRSFFTDLPARIAQAHLVIARAGASTVSELTVIGRPSILVPFPYALDQDQAANAAELAALGATTLVLQKDFTPDWLAAALLHALADQAPLREQALRAQSVAITDAAERLADLVLRLAARKDKHEAAA